MGKSDTGACPLYAFVLLGVIPNWTMARWPRQTWTTIYTYLLVLILFPLLCVAAYGWVRGWWP